MKKNLLAFLLPSLLVLAACGGTGTSSSSEPAVSSEEETSSSSSSSVTPSSSSEEEASTSSSIEDTSSSDEPIITIPTVAATVHVTVAGIDVLDENGIYLGSPNVEGGSAETWGYVQMEKEDDGTYSYTFPEMEIEQYIFLQVYVQNKEGGDWSGVLCNECAGNKDIQILLLEGVTDYDVTATFSSQPDSSNVVSNVKFTLTATDASGDPIDQEGLYIIAYDSVNGGGNETVWTNEGNGVYSYTYAEIAVGAFTINPYLEATDDITKITWNKSDTLGSAGYHFDIQAGVASYSFAASWSNIPTPAPTDGYTLTVTLCLTESLGENAGKPQIVIGSQWIRMSEGADELTWTYSDLYAEGTYSFFFYWWSAEGDHKIFADEAGSNFEIALEDDLSIIVTGAFAAASNVGTLA